MNSIPQITGANKGIGFAIVRKLCKEFSGTVILTGSYCSTKLFPLVILRLHMKLDWCCASLNPTQPFLFRHATLLPKIPFWWRVTTQIWVVLLFGWSNFPHGMANQKCHPEPPLTPPTPHGLFLDQTKKIFWDWSPLALISGSGWSPPPYLKVWIRHG